MRLEGECFAKEYDNEEHFFVVVGAQLSVRPVAFVVSAWVKPRQQTLL